MPQYMLLIGGVDIDTHRKDRDNPEGVVAKYARWADGLTRAAKLVENQKLKDGEGYRIKKVQGHVVDGPFSETKEMISGFFTIEAPSYRDAVSIARECPAVTEQGGYVEVREVASCPGTA